MVPRLNASMSDDVVTPFIRHNWQREWVMTPQDRLPKEILAGAEQVGIRTLGVPEASPSSAGRISAFSAKVMCA